MKKESKHERSEKKKTESKVGEGDPKAHFSIATAMRCKEGRYSLPWFAPPYP